MLSPSLANLLSMGTVGHNHLLHAGQKAFGLVESQGSGDTTHLVVGIRLLCMAWVEFPLNAPLARQIDFLSRSTPLVSRILGAPGLALASRVGRLTEAGEDTTANMLFVQGRHSELEAFFDDRVSQNMTMDIARHAVMLQSMLSRWGWLEKFVCGPIAQVDADMADALLPDILLASGQYEKAVAACERLVRLHGVSLAGLRLAMAYAGTKETARAQSVLKRVLESDPNHTTALLLLDRLAFPTDRQSRLPGHCVVSIYSYNKSKELHRTLESVLASELASGADAVSVRVLVNGSEDDSLAVAKTARKRFRGQMDIVSLPVNVGAPAARNWLLHAAARDNADWIVYLDDDVLVPSDWLVGLASGPKDFPDAGVWGCRVMDAMSPNLSQHVDGFLLDREEAGGQDGTVLMKEPGLESLVPDSLDVRRLCASVTGCCHLFRVKTLLDSRGFDLAFSPSQFDDLDHDLRLLRDGKPAAYLGDVAVTHLRPDFHFMELSEAGSIQAKNHRALLDERHDSHLERMIDIQAALVAADLAARRERLRNVGLLSPAAPGFGSS